MPIEQLFEEIIEKTRNHAENPDPILSDLIYEATGAEARLVKGASRDPALGSIYRIYDTTGLGNGLKDNDKLFLYFDLNEKFSGFHIVLGQAWPLPKVKERKGQEQYWNIIYYQLVHESPYGIIIWPQGKKMPVFWADGAKMGLGLTVFGNVAMKNKAPYVSAFYMIGPQNDIEQELKTAKPITSLVSHMRYKA